MLICSLNYKDGHQVHSLYCKSNEFLLKCSPLKHSSIDRPPDRRKLHFINALIYYRDCLL